MITVRADMPTMAGNITMTCEGDRTIIVYDENNSCLQRRRTWVISDADLTKRILDLGDVNDEIIEAMGEPVAMEFSS